MRLGRRCKVAIIGAFVVGIASGAAGRPAGLADVRDVRVWRQPTHTRVIIELSRAATYRTQVLGDPARIHIEMDGTWIEVDQRAARAQRADAAVRAVRVNQRAPTRARVTVEVDVATRAFRVFHLEHPFRVVLDVFEESAAFLPSGSAEDLPTVEAGGELAVSRVLRSEGDGSPGSQVAVPPPKPSRASRDVPRVAIPRPKPSRGRSEGRASDAATVAIPRPKPLRAGAAIVVDAPASSDAGSRRLGFDLRPVRRVMLDPGHGGRDPGAISSAGLREKDVVLRIAAKLRERLEAAGLEAHTTRADDRYLDLDERTRIANRAQADLFVSIHANASPNHGTQGIETYFLNTGADAQTARVAARENGTSIAELSTLERVLASLRLGYTERFAARLAGSVHGALVARMRAQYPRTGDLGTKRGPFLVLFTAEMPAILVEVGFVTNAAEAERLGTEAFVDAAAEGIAEGIVSYAQSHDESLVAER